MPAALSTVQDRGQLDFVIWFDPGIGPQDLAMTPGVDIDAQAQTGRLHRLFDSHAGVRRHVPGPVSQGELHVVESTIRVRSECLIAIAAKDPGIEPLAKHLLDGSVQ